MRKRDAILGEEFEDSEDIDKEEKDIKITMIIVIIQSKIIDP